ncbi:MAG TPA: hypothetical protein DCY20_06780 [Firmicutes bacterium]|nr:hypothetical protein [Bacillota bacterium]
MIVKKMIQGVGAFVLCVGKAWFNVYESPPNLKELEKLLEQLFTSRELLPLENVINQILTLDQQHVRAHEIKTQLLYESDDPLFLEEIKALLTINPDNEVGLLLRSNWIDAVELKLEIAHRKRQGKIMMRVCELLEIDPENRLAHQIRVKYAYRYKHKRKHEYLEALLQLYPDDAIGQLYQAKEKKTG